MNNYERIRAMSIEEMAEWLAYYFTQYGYKETIQWLESEVKE